MAHRFQLQNRTFNYISFLLKKFFPPISQFQLFSIFHAFVEGPHNIKDASTFVLIFCTPFILHNILIHSFDFRYKTIKLDKYHTNKGALANHRLLMRPTEGRTRSGAG